MPEIFELSTDEEWREALPVLRELRPDLDGAKTLNSRQRLMDHGYKLYGLVH